MNKSPPHPKQGLSLFGGAIQHVHEQELYDCEFVDGRPTVWDAVRCRSETVSGGCRGRRSVGNAAVATGESAANRISRLCVERFAAGRPSGARGVAVRRGAGCFTAVGTHPVGRRRGGTVGHRPADFDGVVAVRDAAGRRQRAGTRSPLRRAGRGSVPVDLRRSLGELSHALGLPHAARRVSLAAC
mgnify:CR=1 FL=1